MGPLLPSRVLLKSASTFTGVLQQFARTAASRESGGIKGAWAQLLDPLPQRKEGTGGDKKALGAQSGEGGFCGGALLRSPFPDTASLEGGRSERLHDPGGCKLELEGIRKHLECPRICLSEGR
ncbi:hypothetical protein FOZ63_031175 [Perkinsus olseni]|uniref:Uncharacterized protein n=1 Tax=Perkinsus olseni TaxID=32597 RepID=A0A7J6QHL9_PEROL|nr:hypothetical protein FOZ63_031175 [Perkinsus olseni]